LNDITKHVLNVLWDLPAAEWPLRPEAAALTEQRQKSGQDFPTAYCQPGSLPASMLILEFKIGSGCSPDRGFCQATATLRGRSTSTDAACRKIGTELDGLVGGALARRDARGRNDRFQGERLAGRLRTPRSEAMRITERYRRRDFGHMDLELTFDDPKYYTRPFGFKTTLTLLPDTDVLEYVCTENQRRYRPPAP
jgi:hypothetical protein